MKKIIALLFISGALVSTASKADEYVNGYYRKNGTYVEPYYRSTPNGNPYDNFSTKGNVNPYTGQVGTVNPYPNTQKSYPSYQPMLPTTPYRGFR